jgi:uncharacterized protein YndB with AHSA1/START domain
MTNNDESTAVSADRQIVICRTFKAPRELVFDALIDPKNIGKWWGPNGFTTTTSKMDVRPGGEWVFVMHGSDGVDFSNRIRYREIVRPELLIYDQGGETPDAPVHFQVTIILTENNSVTEVTMRHVFPTKMARDHVVNNYGAIEGGNQHLARLAEHLALKTGTS